MTGEEGETGEEGDGRGRCDERKVMLYILKESTIGISSDGVQQSTCRRLLVTRVSAEQ